MQIDQGDILGWEFESDTFEFVGIKRGTRFYTPDFKVFALDGSWKYQEIKGWMDKKSKTKLRRMSKYYPQVIIEIIDAATYQAVARELRDVIPTWEQERSRHSKRNGR
jgi:hypothetical protein